MGGLRIQTGLLRLVQSVIALSIIVGVVASAPLFVVAGGVVAIVWLWNTDDELGSHAMADEEIAMIPRVVGVNLGISFFEETADPVLVLNAIFPVDVMETQLAHHGGVDGQCVVPLAFTASDLQALIPQIIEGVIRCQTVIEMLTTWPEKRQEIIQNLMFRWTGNLPEGEDEADGAA